MVTTNAQSTVFVVDDDLAIRDSLEELIESLGLPLEFYTSAEEFLDAYDPPRPGCLVLDVRMPGMTGLELQAKLKADGVDIPIIMITGHGDVPMAVQSLKMGAVDFIEKPFRGAALLGRIRTAIKADGEKRRQEDENAEIVSRISRLTARERQIMDLVAAGYPNKTIATRLGIALRTVEDHRAHIMEKMKADSVAELVRLVVSWESNSRHS